MEPTIHEFVPADADWATRHLTDDFGAPMVVSRGVLHDARELPGFVARMDGNLVGLATYRLDWRRV